MANRKGRDWSEWKKEVTGMRRLENEWKSPREARYCQSEDTTTSIAIPREFRKSGSSDKKEMVKWFLIFIAILFVRKVYFEMTKHEKIRNHSSYKSRMR